VFPSSRHKKPFIVGVSGPELTPQERDFFKTYPPVGFILFARNLASLCQVRELTYSLREVACQETVPILIDEEGGQVSRLNTLSPSYQTALVSSLEGPSAVKDHYETISQWLVSLGITVNCAPVLDVRSLHTASFLVNRCFSADPHQVASLGRVAIQAMKSQGVTPVIKHLPGHGLSRQDSHEVLPTIGEDLNDLGSHFFPFQQCGDLGAWGMTSHLVFSSLGGDDPVTFSGHIIEHIIRKKLGFQGFLITDDLYMGALDGISLQERIVRALGAGHDAALVCHGRPQDWEPAIRDLPDLCTRSLGLCDI
jgi:beta-N-acetylhexosaminidase